PFAMENPEKGIVERTASRVTWISNTTGDDDGVDVTLEASPDAILHFRTPVLDLDVPLRDLAGGMTRTFPAGGVDLRVFMRRLPRCSTMSSTCGRGRRMRRRRACCSRRRSRRSPRTSACA